MNQMYPYDEQRMEDWVGRERTKRTRSRPFITKILYIKNGIGFRYTRYGGIVLYRVKS